MLTTDASENARLCEHQERSSLFINILILGSTHRRGMREDLGVLMSIILFLICTELFIVRIYIGIEDKMYTTSICTGSITLLIAISRSFSLRRGSCGFSCCSCSCVSSSGSGCCGGGCGCCGCCCGFLGFNGSQQSVEQISPSFALNLRANHFFPGQLFDEAPKSLAQTFITSQLLKNRT